MNLMLSPRFLATVIATLVTVNAVRCISLKVGADDFDWRQKGVISPVSNEGRLGTVMGIILAEGVESLHAIQAGIRVVVLSRKEVVDCCLDSSHQPIFPGYDCFPRLGGLCTETSYRSTGGKCNNGTCQAVGKVTKTGNIPINREDVMVSIIKQTPLTAYIDASLTSFQEYVSGIYSDPSCNQTNLDHAVQIVGYGSTGGQDYWIIKNSWGRDWGEEGYMRIARGKNMCGIATFVYYPINQK